MLSGPAPSCVGGGSSVSGGAAAAASELELLLFLDGTALDAPVAEAVYEEEDGGGPLAPPCNRPSGMKSSTASSIEWEEGDDMAEIGKGVRGDAPPPPPAARDVRRDAAAEATSGREAVVEMGSAEVGGAVGPRPLSEVRRPERVVGSGASSTSAKESCIAANAPAAGGGLVMERCVPPTLTAPRLCVP